MVSVSMAMSSAMSSELASTPKQFPVITQTTLSPLFSIVYLPSRDLIAGTFEWDPSALASSDSQPVIQVALVHKYTGKRLTAWTELRSIHSGSGNSLQSELSYQKDTAHEVLPELIRTELVFSVNEPVQADGEYPVTHYFDIGATCTSYPGLFLNMDTMSIGCPLP
ncbi:MAG: hypothetical protein EOP09_00760 [Proteobacteria bacterium]|nr:MAG: hypothetical protein EOP09_00760 [Pseudomonadota bacterium]